MNASVFLRWGFLAICGLASPLLPAAAAVPDAVDDAATVVAGKKVKIAVLDNDVIPASGVKLTVVQQPARGRAKVIQGSVLRYDSWSRHPGTYRIVYRIQDSTGRSDQATVTVTVVPAGAAPLKAKADAATLEAGGEVVVNVVRNDSVPGRVVRLEILEQPTAGTAKVLNRKRIRYRAPAGYEGRDTLVYRIWDERGAQATASVTFEVTCPPCTADAPTVILGWEPPHTPVDAYQIFYADNPDASSMIREVSVLRGEVDPADPSVVFDAARDLGALAGDTICFRVRSVAAGTVSALSDPICRTI